MELRKNIGYYIGRCIHSETPHDGERPVIDHLHAGWSHLAVALRTVLCPSQVKGEIVYQARRLDSHPSLAIWGGGNEVEASFRWFPDSRDNPQFYTPDYIQVSSRTCPASLPVFITVSIAGSECFNLCNLASRRLPFGEVPL